MLEAKHDSSNSRAEPTADHEVEMETTSATKRETRDATIRTVHTAAVDQTAISQSIAIVEKAVTPIDIMNH